MIAKLDKHKEDKPHNTLNMSSNNQQTNIDNRITTVERVVAIGVLNIRPLRHDE